MADVLEDRIVGIVQRNEGKAAQAQVPIELGTAEAQTITVQKPSESSFSASAGSSVTQIYTTLYVLEIDAGDIDELGITWFKCAGATDTTYFPVMVVEYDPYTEGALSDLALKHRAASPG